MDETNRLAKNIMLTRILSQNACESFEKQNNKKSLLTIKVRALFLIGEYGKVSPSLLIDKLYIAKSNLALICKQLLLEGLIESNQDLVDKRIIYYNLSNKGRAYLNEKLTIIEKNVSHACSTEDLNKINTDLEKINKILSKKF